MRDSASPIIDRFSEQLNDEASKLRAGGITNDMRNTPKGREAWSTAPAINRRPEAIQKAVAAAEALKLEPLDAGEISARLEVLRAGLPEVTLDKPS